MKNQTVKHSSIPLPPLPSRMLLQTRKSGPPPTSHSHHTGQAMGLWYPPVESSGFVPPVQTNYQSVTSHGPLIHDPSMYRILFFLLRVIIIVIHTYLFCTRHTYSKTPKYMCHKLLSLLGFLRHLYTQTTAYFHRLR